MIKKLKGYLKLALVIFTMLLCANTTKSVYVIDECASGYRLYYYSDVLVNTPDFMSIAGVKTIFTVKCKNLENRLVFAIQTFLRFVPNISNDKQIGSLVNFVCQGAIVDPNSLFLESVMRLAETSSSPAIVNVKAILRY